MLQGNGMYLTVSDVNTLLAGPLSGSMHIFTFNPCVIIVSLLCKKAVGESFTSLVVIQTVDCGLAPLQEHRLRRTNC